MREQMEQILEEVNEEEDKRMAIFEEMDHDMIETESSIATKHLDGCDPVK